MTSRFSTGTKNLAAKAVVVSFLCHAGLLSLFVFTIRSKPAEAKTLMVFLGSILRKHDVTYSAANPPDKKGAMAPSIAITPVHGAQGSTSASFLTAPKPNLKIQPKPDTKQAYKPVMEYVPLPKKSGQVGSAPVSVEPSLPDYRPLKLETR